MQIIEDIGNKRNMHTTKNEYWESHGAEVLRLPLPVGDYVLVNEKIADVIKRKADRNMTPHKMDFLGAVKSAVDTKQNMAEIAGNVCGKEHARFRDECILAQNCGIKLYVLVENEDGIKNVSDVCKWQNPRAARWYKLNNLHKQGKALKLTIPKQPPVNGETLMKSMRTMELKYNVEFWFCTPQEAGAKVIELLQKEVFI